MKYTSGKHEIRTFVSFLHSFLHTTTVRRGSQTHSPSSDGCSHVGQGLSQDTETSNTQSPITHHIYEITAITNETACSGYKGNATFFVGIYTNTSLHHWTVATKNSTNQIYTYY